MTAVSVTAMRTAPKARRTFAVVEADGAVLALGFRTYAEASALATTINRQRRQALMGQT